MKILLGITGGIAAYKIPDVITGLRAQGHEVQVVVTQAALEFITEQTLSTISQKPVLESLLEVEGRVCHIEVAQWCDLFLVAPATANTIGKFAHGIADNLLTTIHLALPIDAPKMIFPAMNTKMYEHPATQMNLNILKDYGWTVHLPIEGKLACGDVGIGKMPKPRTIVERVDEYLKLLSEEE